MITTNGAECILINLKHLFEQGVELKIFEVADFFKQSLIYLFPVNRYALSGFSS